MVERDTIVALSTARGRAAIAVVRVSGPRALEAVTKLAGPLGAPRVMVLRRLVWDDALLDEALIVRFEAGGSYTGDDLVEIHGHGSAAVVKALLSALIEHCGCRPAEAGEFTRRAVGAGCLDLAQAEAVIDLIDAESEAQRQLALEVLDGAVSRKVAGWRGKILDLLALAEASIDFADEEDAPVDVSADIERGLKRLAAEIEGEIRGSAFARKTRDGFNVALVGPPNVGKSSLLNYLSRQDIAIVSDIAGTTRDILEARVILAGHAVSIFDLAGLRDAENEIEKVGIKRAVSRAAEADLRLFLRSANEGHADGYVKMQPDDVKVWTKADLALGSGDIAVSVVTGDGIEALSEIIVERLELRQPKASGLFAHERQIHKLTEAGRALSEARGSGSMELSVFHLRSASRMLEDIVGKIAPDDILDGVFSRFCIGK